jgi:hypothetical protein
MNLPMISEHLSLHTSPTRAPSTHRGVAGRGVSLVLLTMLVASVAACTGSEGGGDDSADSGDSGGDDVGCSGATPCDASVEIGQGYSSFAPLGGADAPWQLVLGGQGLYMFPMTLQLSGFDMPADPGDWGDPKLPQLAVTFDVPGHPGAVGGHFVRIANYPLASVDLGDGTFEVVYVPLIIPDADAMDPLGLHEAPGTLEVEIRGWDGERVVERIDVVLDSDPIEQQPPVG